jgi:hypothetical protein
MAQLAVEGGVQLLHAALSTLECLEILAWGECEGDHGYFGINLEIDIDGAYFNVLEDIRCQVVDGISAEIEIPELREGLKGARQEL